MMKIFTEEHEIFRRTFRRFLEKEIIPYADEWEEKDEVPRSAWKKMGGQGYLCPWLEEKYGGSEAGFEYSLIIIEEIAKSGFQMGVSYTCDVTAHYINSFGSEELKAKWLPGCASGDIILGLGMTEPNTGSDLQAIKTTAVRDGNDYIINGQKTFITHGTWADMIVLACKTDPKAVPPYKGVSLIAVEDGRPGFIKNRKLKKMGMHGTTAAELYFEDCRVPVTNLIGQEGMGFAYMMDKLQQERLVLVAEAQAYAEKILADAIEYAKTREAFGQPIIKFQHNTFKIVEMATEVELGRTFLNSLLAEHLAGKDIITKVSMAKWWVTEMANRVAYNCLQLYGGYGYMEEYLISRLYRTIRAYTIIGGTTEIMKAVVAKRMDL